MSQDWTHQPAGQVPPLGSGTLDSLPAACDEILHAEQLVRDSFGITHPQHAFWSKLADVLNAEQASARSGFTGPALAAGRWTAFNRILAMDPSFTGLREEGEI